jgi:PAS domain S-box-containing protein
MLAKGFQEMTYPEDLARDVEFMQQVFKGQKESRKTQKRYVHKNGAVIWVNLNVSVVRGSERKPLFFVVQLEDVTEKRESEQMFRDLVEKSLVGVYIVQNGKFAYVNPRFAEIYGYKQEELINTISAEMVVHEQDRPKALEKIRQRISGEEQSQHYEAIGQRKDGQQIFVEAYGSSTIYRGQPAIIGTVLDISERKYAEAELIDSEERKRILVNSALDAIVSSDENGVIISWNPQAEKLFGWTEKEITGKRLTDTIIPRQYHERHTKGMAHYHQTGEGPILHKLIEVTAVDRQGREFIAELTVIPIIQNGKTTFTAFLRDISKRKQAEQEVTKLNRLYKFISEINESVLKLDNSEAIHREACRIAVEHGKFRMAWIGLYREQEKEVIPVASAGYEDGYLQQVKITAKGNVPEGMGPTGRALRTGKLYYCNDVANDPVMLPWRTEALKRDYRSSMSIPIVVNGRVYGVYTLYMPESNFFNESEIKLLQEVTDNIAYALDKIRIAAMHRAATNELQESEGKFRSLVEQSFVGVFILQDGKLSYVNPGFEKIFGYTREKLVPSMRLENLIHETDLESLKRNDFVRIKRKGAKSQNVVRAIRSDGAILYIDIIASSIHYQQRPAIIGTVIDITDQLEEEKRISKAVTEAQENERIQIGMELHDNVKQLLAASLLHLDYVKTHITDTTMVVTTIDHLKAYIREAIDELRRLSHQLAPSVDATVPLSEKVQDLVSNLNLAGQVKVTLQLEEITVPVSTAVQLALYRILQEQFSNILKHAQARHVFISLKNEGESIVLIIRDDGSGFDTSVKKEGIGLVNIRRRATMLNGQVSIISSPGYGCEVQVHIPL